VQPASTATNKQDKQLPKFHVHVQAASLSAAQSARRRAFRRPKDIEQRTDTAECAGSHLSELESLRDLYDIKLFGVAAMVAFFAIVPILWKNRHQAADKARVAAAAAAVAAGAPAAHANGAAVVGDAGAVNGAASPEAEDAAKKRE
jgi:hypothetical protein